MKTLAEIMAGWSPEMMDEYIRIGLKCVPGYKDSLAYQSDLEELDETMAHQRHIRDDSQER
jgi:hypothetical protein